MTSLIQAPRLQAALKRFHNDERGMQSIETIVILAVAAVVLAGIVWIWDDSGTGGVKTTVATYLNALFNNSTTNVSSWISFGG